MNDNPRYDNLDEPDEGDRIYLILEFDEGTTREAVKAYANELEPLTKTLADKHNAHGHVDVFVGSVEDVTDAR